MDVSWLSLLMMAAAFAASVLLVAVCLDCGNRSPLASISQTAASEEYVPSSGFIVVHPYAGQARLDQNLVHSPSTLKPHPIPAGRGSDQTRPYTPTETESNPSYENPSPEMDFPDSDAEGNGYIEVLPETEPSQASTPSLDGANYVNLEDDLDSDSESDHNYENVKSASTPDEDENYVNV